MTGTGQDTVRLSVEVEVGLERAFEVFTREFDRIKPREHNLLGEAIEETVLEPRTGGRLYDRGVDGATCDWGRVLAFEPPHRLLLGWNVSPYWQLESDPQRCSEVEVRFTELDAGRTRVDLEHRHLERHGEGWQGLQGGLQGDGGWPLYLDRYAKVLGEG